jgi:hypothetical protein
VIRGGFGIVYSFVPDLNLAPPVQGVNAPAGLSPFVSLGTGQTLPQPLSPNFSAGVFPTIPGATNSAPPAVDPNAGRPPRQYQWSIGVQREIMRDLVVEASYVGNRGIWETGAGANLGLLQQVSPATFAAFGLSPYTNPADDLFLSNSVSSPAVVARFGHPLLPYPGFAGTVLQALETYPQFSTASSGIGPNGIPVPYSVRNAPTGKSWYDALQIKATKRLSAGLQFTATYTYSKALVSNREDFFNPGSSSKTYQITDRPSLFNANLIYTVPNYIKGTSVMSRALSEVARDWQFGVFLQYGSGFLLTPPTVTNAGLNPLAPVNGVVNSGVAPVSYMLSVPGQPLFLKDINGTINPFTDQILNPKAFVNPHDGQFGSSALIGNFRGQRLPMENFSVGRNFKLTERVGLHIRAEFVNIFNRTELAYPSTVNPLAAISRNAAGQNTGGYGTINAVIAPFTNSTPHLPSTTGNVQTTGTGCNGGQGLCALPRTGTLIARFTF